MATRSSVFLTSFNCPIKAVKPFFDVDVSDELFDETIPSLGVAGYNTPAYLCPAGLKRMALEFRKFPEQYKTNIDFLKFQNEPFRSGVEFLEKEYNNGAEKFFLD